MTKEPPDKRTPETISRQLLITKVAQRLEKARLKLDKRHAAHAAKMEMMLRQAEEASDPENKS